MQYLHWWNNLILRVINLKTCLCYMLLLSNQLKHLIKEEKLIPLTQYGLLVEHNFIRSRHNSNNIDATVDLIFVVEPKSLFLVCSIKNSRKLKYSSVIKLCLSISTAGHIISYHIISHCIMFLCIFMFHIVQSQIKIPSQCSDTWSGPSVCFSHCVTSWF